MPREDKPVPVHQIACAVDDILWKNMIFHLHRTGLLEEECKDNNLCGSRAECC